MEQQTVIWVTIAAYAVMMLVIGIINQKSARSISSFTVGGRKAGAWLSALSYGAAYFSAVMFVGYAGGTGWNFGLWAVTAGLGNAVFGSYLAWKVLARRVRDTSNRLKIKSMPRFFEIRYASSKMKFFSAAVIFIFLLPYSASVYKGLTSICSVLLGVDDQICMIIIAAASAVILILGGYMAALKADFVQGIVMMVGIVLLIIFVMKSPIVVSGGGVPGMWEYMKNNGLAVLKPMDALGLIATVLMTSFGTWGLPQMVHKYYGIKDDNEVKRGTRISTFFAVLIAGGGYFVGSMSHLFFTEVPKGGIDYIIPNMLKSAALPAILLGLVLVLLIAASVSTLSSITLTATSSLTLDLIKPKAKKLSEKSTVTMTRVFCLLFIAASYIIANTDTPILDMMSYSWGILSGSFLAPFLLALYWKKVTNRAAWSGILTGFITAMIPCAAKLISIMIPQNTLFKTLAGFGPHFAVSAMILSLLVCIIVTAATPKETAAKQYNELFYEGTLAEE